MWTVANRRRYDRSQLRYPSDLTDAEWAYVAPMIPPAKPGGNRRHVDVREVMNGIMYILSTGCQWRAIPKDLPQAQRVDEDVALLALDLLARIVAVRINAGPPFSALFTLWLSMIAAVGLASRSPCSRHST